VIGVVDYGAGNLRSVTNVLDALGARYVQRIVLPGVGHFGQLARSLDERELRDPIAGLLDAGVPYLGICLGMQVLFESSAEAPGARGFGVFAGEAAVIEGAERLPHMGWNTVGRRGSSRLLDDADDDARFYFANSYACPVIDETTGVCRYGSTFTAVVERGSVFGVQFHPEKSGAAGRALVARFLEV
jgi:imidazole glycerol phosphate synthase glutamine amidotransferase subunit